MPHLSARTNLLDASALVKLVVIEEERSDKLRSYLATESSWYTTSFCFYEALGVLKVQHYYRHTLTAEQFRDASFQLMAEFRATPNVHDLDLTDP
jgi:predicted nucleic acid-binding protein